MTERFTQLKEQYQRIPIPGDLNGRVRSICARYERRSQPWRWALASVAALFVFSIGIINALPAQAATLHNVPVLGPLVRVMTFVDYQAEESGYMARIRIPRVEGLNNQELEEVLNAQLLADGQAFIAAYQADLEQLKSELGEETIHKGVETYYEVMASNAEVFSLRVEYFTVAGSSDTRYDFYNVNQRTGELITLDTLFREGTDYLTILNDYLLEQMRATVDEAGVCPYWVSEEDLAAGMYKGIDGDHNFYINQEGKLVIAFDKYEVGPGYIGTPEFVIPTELIAPLLAEGAPIH